MRPLRSGARGPARPRLGVAGVVLLLLVTLFGLLLGRLGQLQLVQGPQLVRAASTVNTRTVTDHAVRGRILDRSGQPRKEPIRVLRKPTTER